MTTKNYILVLALIACGFWTTGVMALAGQLYYFHNHLA